jgi:hypothetical protein
MTDHGSEVQCAVVPEEWWSGLGPGGIYPVMRSTNLAIKASLRLTGDGLFWGVLGGERDPAVRKADKRIGY